MGGLLSVVVRQRDGSVQSVAGWTNPLPRTLFDPDFIANTGRDEFDSYLDYYRANPCYGATPRCAPLGYGIVVVDRQQQRILSHQLYTSIGEQHPLYLRQPEAIKGDNVDRFDRLLQQQRLYWFDAGGTVQGQFTATTRAEAVVELDRHEAELKRRQPHNLLMLRLDMRPWQIADYEPNGRTAQTERVKAEMAKMGFQFSPADEQAWQTWQSWKDEEENDEEEQPSS